MDRLGHLNHIAYHELFYEARAALLEPLRDEGMAVVVARVEVDYLHEVRQADGHVDLTVRVGEVRTRSFEIEHELCVPDGTPAARSRAVVVAWDAQARAPRALTERERGVLSGA